MDPGKLFQIITNSTLLATRLLTKEVGDIEFSASRYCVVLPEDTPLSSTVAQPSATHKKGNVVKYRLSGGNRDGLFTINQNTGVITLAAKLDYELQAKHELIVSAENATDGSSALAVIQVSVADVNDNSPMFKGALPPIVVVEDDAAGLPKILLKVQADDLDSVDKSGLVYSISGSGIDGYKRKDTFFSINPFSGELLQLKPLDRDPPEGRSIWEVNIRVMDGWSDFRTEDGFLTPGGQRSGKLKTGWEDVSYYYAHKRRRRFAGPKIRWNSNKTLKTNKGLQMTNKRVMIGLKGQSDERFSQIPNVLETIKRKAKREEHQRRKKNQENFDFSSTESTTEVSIANSIKLSRKTRGCCNRIKDKSYFKIFCQDIFDDNCTHKKQFLLLKKAVRPHWKSIMDLNIKKTGNKTLRKLCSFLKENKTIIRPEKKNNEAHLRQKIFSFGQQGVKSFEEEKTVDLSLAEICTNLEKGFQNQTFLNNKKNNQKVIDYLHIFQKVDSPYILMADYGKLQSQRKKILKRSPKIIRKNNSQNDPLDAGGCVHYDPFRDDLSSAHEAQLKYYEQNVRKESSEPSHVAEITLSIQVEDINDNTPQFPDSVMYGEVQENGPIELSVAIVSAWDSDEGKNAQLTYAIERNILDGMTGMPLYQIDSTSGLIRTAVCCLDRETTPQHSIVVSATDGGGLTSSGTVVVRLVDVNDNSPRLTKKFWNVTIDETFGTEPPSNDTILELSVEDKDTSNYFFYRIVEHSGWGWEYFGIRSVGPIGQLFPNMTLDYEQASHARGFKFMIQVTDKGRGSWDDHRHTDSAWISVHINDINDNVPHFQRSHVHITVQEDTNPGTLLTTLTAHDPDKGGKQSVKYFLKDDSKRLSVEEDGGVRLWRHLDRETTTSDVLVVEVVATDFGTPPLSSTATLAIHITDVNDCPPRLNPPTTLHILEGRPSTLLGVLTATDDDSWARGHGPPFNFSLAQNNPDWITELVTIKVDSSLDSGRGGAELWTTGPLDREAAKELILDIQLQDNLGLSTVDRIKIIVDDINDNPMNPGSKTIYLWKPLGGGSTVALGRVYVDDPDDWDVQDKTFSWVGRPNPLFTLDQKNGLLFASRDLRKGRYVLLFNVDDKIWNQKNVPANVTVEVNHLSPDALVNAIPITIFPATPEDLTRNWNPKVGGGQLGFLMKELLHILKDVAKSLEVVSVYGSQDESSEKRTVKESVFHRQAYLMESLSCVWFCAKDQEGLFLDPIKLQGSVAMKINEIERSTKLKLLVEDAVSEYGFQNGRMSTLSPSQRNSPSSAAFLPSTALPLQVVDGNSTSLITPRLSRYIPCSPAGGMIPTTEECQPGSCHNGGKCINGELGIRKCICPSWSAGPSCKILSRTFLGKGWVWIQPLTRCLPLKISLAVMTDQADGVLLIAGTPTSVQPSDGNRNYKDASSYLSLHIINGQPEMLLGAFKKETRLRIQSSIVDNYWHTIHVLIDDQGVSMMLDYCDGTLPGNRTFDSCLSRVLWFDSKEFIERLPSIPLQVGGIAGGSFSVAGRQLNGLHGCISHLSINDQLVDFGEPAFSGGNTEFGCRSGLCNFQCSFRGICSDSEDGCECLLSNTWDQSCGAVIDSVTLSNKGFTIYPFKLSLNPFVLTVEIRIRTKDAHGELIHLPSRNLDENALRMFIKDGVFCSSHNAQGSIQVLCVNGVAINDGLWHVVEAERHKHNFLIKVDDGDLWHKNESLFHLESRHNDGSFQEIQVNPENGIPIGGGVDESGPAFTGCLANLRINGNPIPFTSPSSKRKTLIQEKKHSFQVGCFAPPQTCNHTCTPPLRCLPLWSHNSCSCAFGEMLSANGVCEDINECEQNPCLFDGTCIDRRGGYMCECGSSYTGKNCEWDRPPGEFKGGFSLALYGVLSASVLLLVIFLVFATIRVFRHQNKRPNSLQKSGDKKGERINQNSASHVEKCPEIKEIRKEEMKRKRKEDSPYCLSEESEYALRDLPMLDAAHKIAIMPIEDLRAYAYEGEGSSSTSSFSFTGVKSDTSEETRKSDLAPGFRDVLAILKSTPDCPNVKLKKRDKKFLK